MSDIRDDIPYESLNEEERKERERKKVIEHLLYEYCQADMKQRIEDMSRRTERFMKTVFQQASNALNALDWKNIPKMKVVCDYPLKKEAEVLNNFTDKLKSFDEKEKDEHFHRMNHCVEKAKAEVKNMERKGGMKSDRDWNMMRQRFSDLAGACKKFNNPDDKNAFRKQENKQVVEQMQKHAEQQKLELNKAQDKQVEDFNTKMKKLVEIYKNTFEAKSKLEESGILPKADGTVATGAFQLNAKSVADTLISLITMHKQANELRDGEVNGIDEIDVQIMECSKNILNYFQAKPEVKKECGLSDEQLMNAKAVVEKYYLNNVKKEIKQPLPTI